MARYPKRLPICAREDITSEASGCFISSRALTKLYVYQTERTGWLWSSVFLELSWSLRKGYWDEIKDVARLEWRWNSIFPVVDVIESNECMYLLLLQVRWNVHYHSNFKLQVRCVVYTDLRSSAEYPVYSQVLKPSRLGFIELLVDRRLFSILPRLYQLSPWLSPWVTLYVSSISSKSKGGVA